MSYRRGNVWWYKFAFCGRVYRESAKTTNVRVAERAERNRHRQLEESYNGLSAERPKPTLFSVAAEEWLEIKEGTLAPKSYGVEQNSLQHLKPVFGQKLLGDIDAAMLSRYVGLRRKEKAADKSIKHELATVRGILKRAKLWAAIADDELLHDSRTVTMPAELFPRRRRRRSQQRAERADHEGCIPPSSWR